MSSLRKALADHLRIRRRLGFEMPQDGRLLEGFVEFLERAGAQRITTELALSWARLPAHAHPHRWRQRLSVARGFARHIATIDPASEVPSNDLLPATRPRIAPYGDTRSRMASTRAGRTVVGRAAVRVCVVDAFATIASDPKTASSPPHSAALSRVKADLRRTAAGKSTSPKNRQRGCLAWPVLTSTACRR